jgi:TetR/AcrR family transcriptional regulator
MKRKKRGTTRRLGVESSKTRARLIEAAAQIIRKEGYAAVTAGRLSEKFGLKRHIVHYYFHTMEDLCIAVMRRQGEKVRDLLTQALESREPLRALWEHRNAMSAATSEFIALASHRKAARVEMKRHTEEFRRIQIKAVERQIQLQGIEPAVPPVVMVIALSSVAQSLAVEADMDISMGHSETEATVDKWLRAFTGKDKCASP